MRRLLPAVAALALLGGCADTGARQPSVTVTNSTPQIVTATVEVGGQGVDFTELRSGEKRRISYQPQQPSGVTVRWAGYTDTLPYRIDPAADPLSNNVTIILQPGGATLDPGRHR